jgi:hypothetical protein
MLTPLGELKGRHDLPHITLPRIYCFLACIIPAVSCHVLVFFPSNTCSYELNFFVLPYLFNKYFCALLLLTCGVFSSGTKGSKAENEVSVLCSGTNYPA